MWQDKWKRTYAASGTGARQKGPAFAGSPGRGERPTSKIRKASLRGDHVSRLFVAEVGPTSASYGPTLRARRIPEREVWARGRLPQRMSGPVCRGGTGRRHAPHGSTATIVPNHFGPAILIMAGPLPPCAAGARDLGSKERPFAPHLPFPRREVAGDGSKTRMAATSRKPP